MDLKTAEKILDLYHKIKELEFRLDDVSIHTKNFCMKMRLTGESEKLILEIVSTDINRQLEECMKKLNSIKIVNDVEGD